MIVATCWSAMVLKDLLSPTLTGKVKVVNPCMATSTEQGSFDAGEVFIETQYLRPTNTWFMKLHSTSSLDNSQRTKQISHIGWCHELDKSLTKFQSWLYDLRSHSIIIPPARLWGKLMPFQSWVWSRSCRQSWVRLAAFNLSQMRRCLCTTFWHWTQKFSEACLPEKLVVWHLKHVWLQPQALVCCYPLLSQDHSCPKPPSAPVSRKKPWGLPLHLKFAGQLDEWLHACG